MCIAFFSSKVTTVLSLKATVYVLPGFFFFYWNIWFPICDHFCLLLILMISTSVSIIARLLATCTQLVLKLQIQSHLLLTVSCELFRLKSVWRYATCFVLGRQIGCCWLYTNLTKLLLWYLQVQLCPKIIWGFTSVYLLDAFKVLHKEMFFNDNSLMKCQNRNYVPQSSWCNCSPLIESPPWQNSKRLVDWQWL